VISDEPIGSPVCKHPSIAVVFNNPSLEKYAPLVIPGGLLVVNESLVVQRPERADISVVILPATALASELGEVKMANMVLFGALLAFRPIVALETVQRVLREKLGARKAHLIEINHAA
jgi:2-oxoglutarate ferredoxin oxidoreductase subunit gamma